MPNLVWNQETYGRVVTGVVTSETRWLDAGCGHQILPDGLGYVEGPLTAKARLIVGVDLEPGALRGHGTLRFAICSRLESLPLSPESFDLVSSNMVVEHLPDPSVTFRELALVLRPGGILVIHTPNLFNYAVAASRLARYLLPRRAIVALARCSDSRGEQDVFPTFYRANTRERLRRLLSGEGLFEEACWMLVGPQPIFNFFAPIAFLELLMQRATMSSVLSRFRTSILGVYRKSAAGRSDGLPAPTDAKRGASKGGQPTVAPTHQEGN